MDDTSWRARLAKNNINILDNHDGRMFVEFTYHPKPGVFKWCKTMYAFEPGTPVEEWVKELLDEVLALRKELEN